MLTMLVLLKSFFGKGDGVELVDLYLVDSVEQLKVTLDTLSAWSDEPIVLEGSSVQKLFEHGGELMLESIGDWDDPRGYLVEVISKEDYLARLEEEFLRKVTEVNEAKPIKLK